MLAAPRHRLTLFSLIASTCVMAVAAAEYAPLMPRASQSLLLDITISGRQLLAVGEHGHVLRSTNEGRSWTQALVPTTKMLTTVHAVGEQAWAGGHDGLILTTNDGRHWRIQRDGLSAQAQANIERREAALADLAGLERRLSEQPDDPDLAVALEEAQWALEDAEEILAEPVFTSPVLDLWFANALSGWAVGAFGLFLETHNGGQTWRDISDRIDNPDEYHLNAISGDAEGRILVAAEGGLLFRSLDGGDSWQSLESPYHGSWFGTLYEPQHDALLVFGLRGTVYRSTDFGDNWAAGRHDSTGSLAGGGADSKGNIYLVGAVGTVLRSIDGGSSFSAHRTRDGMPLSAAASTGDTTFLVGRGGIRSAEDLEP